jgi:hypothetical protein
MIIASLFMGIFSCCSKSAEDFLLRRFLGLRDRHEKGYEQTLNKVFEALDNKNKEELKQLFAVSVTKENPNLDKQIDDLLFFYKGPKISEKRSGAASSEKINYGIRIKEFREDFIITTAETKYYVWIVMQSRNDQNNDDEGIHILEFATEEAHNSKYFMWHTARHDVLDYKELQWYVEKVDVPGIYIQTSPEKRSDVIRVNSRNFEYKAVNRNLTVDNFLTFVSRDDDFSRLIDSIGEPNAMWSNFGFYYFEIANKQVVVCNVEAGKIVYMYVADEEQELYTLWTTDKMIKIYGNYVSYTPTGGRELSEEFFKSFILKSKSLKDLAEKIGQPDGDDKSFYCYYQLTDKRFVGLHHRGDLISGVFIADAEKRLYTIWEEKR